MEHRPELLVQCPGNYEGTWKLWHMFCNCIFCAKELAQGLQAKLVCPLCHEDVTGLSLDFRSRGAMLLKKETKEMAPSMGDQGEPMPSDDDLPF